jgi:uracil-DNA glycosylase
VTPDERRQALDAIAEEIKVCTRCRLHEHRTNAVPGEGHPETEVVFVGEGPGFNEDQQGRPFVGAAGGLLNELLRGIGWKREEVFITNVVKCRPPGNRDPEPDEIATCRPFLRRQLEVLDPAVVVTLGRFSLGSFMPGARIGQAHGTTRAVDPETGAADATAYALYHPAAAFRQASLRETLFREIANLPDLLIAARRRRAADRTAVAGQPTESVGATPAPGDSAAAPAESAPTPAQSAPTHPESAVTAVLQPVAPASAAPEPDDDQLSLSW